MKNKSFIGIDISKNVIDVSIFCEGTPIKDFPHDVFNNSRKGFGAMCTWLKKNHVVLSNCLFGMEFTGSYSMELEKFLNARKYQFCMLSTHVIKHYPMGPKDKSDKIDSAKIADFLYRYNGTECVKPYKMPDKTMQRLKALMNERKFLVEQRTCFMNRRQLCTTKEDAQLYDSYIKKLSHDIENIELEEQKLLATDESLFTTYWNLLTIPGIGFVNAINVIVITRNFTAFETARQYASYVGVAPHFRTSGTSVRWRPRPSARCDVQAKADLSMAATVAVQYDAELQSFYNRKLGGKQDSDTKRKALNAVKFKLVLRMFAIGKQNRKWEPLDSKSSNEKLAIS